MELAVGEIFEGKVTGIAKFGAFVALPDGKSGLVHISEIANTYVSEVRDHLQDGQSVKVKVIGIGPDGKINLSIKKAQEQPQQSSAQPRSTPPQQYNNNNNAQRSFARPRAEDRPAPTFEDKLKQFMQDSDSRMSGNKLYDRKTSARKRRD